MEVPALDTVPVDIKGLIVDEPGKVAYRKKLINHPK